MTRILQTGILKATSAALTFVVILASALIASRPAQAQTFTVLYTFSGTFQGQNPWSGVVKDAAGNLYGTTELGGKLSLGTVFEVDTAGNETVLHSFSGPDGEGPYGTPLLDKDGTLYGTTSSGGDLGYGVVFKISKSGKFKRLHSFTGKDGCTLLGGVIEDADKNLYGAAYGCGTYGGGTVWKVSQSGQLTVLHNFANGNSDGSNPLYATLLMDKTGDLYGFTFLGGKFDAGVVYKLSSTKKIKILHSFAGGTTDGCSPFGAPVMDAAGTLYGTAGCGANDLGIVWSLSTAGIETILHNFAGGPADGKYPYAGVVLDDQGNIYGTTSLGGASGYGTAWELDPSGTLTLLQSFAGLSGAYVYDGLLRDAAGTLYGTAFTAGNGGNGTVWSIAP